MLPRPLYISILDATARCGSHIAALTRRDVELFYVVGSARRCVASAYLADALFPDADPADAENRLHVAVYRLRRRCGEPRVICRERFGYVAGHGVRFDLADIEADFRSTCKPGPLDDARRARLGAAYGRLAASAFVASAGPSPVSVTIGEHVAQLMRRIGERIARDELAGGRIERDACAAPAFAAC